MDDRMATGDPLAALGAHLAARGLKVEYAADGLKVANPDVRGCCAEVAHESDTITCRRRPEDSIGSRWFYTSWGHPIAPVYLLEDAALYVVGYLNRHPQTAGVGAGS